MGLFVFFVFFQRPFQIVYNLNRGDIFGEKFRTDMCGRMMAVRVPEWLDAQGGRGMEMGRWHGRSPQERLDRVDSTEHPRKNGGWNNTLPFFK
jgi:hypothetical protein